MSLTDVAENRVLDWLTGQGVANGGPGTAPTPPTMPLKVALVTTASTDAAAGTEVTGGSYARITGVFTAASGGSSSNNALLRFNNMPACTVVGFEIWDSAGTPVRWRWSTFASAVTFVAGDAAEFAVGALVLTQD